MKTSTLILSLALLGGVAAGGYWLGARSHGAAPETASAATAASAPKARKLLYYRNPMGLADTSPTPKKDPMGMDYIAVYEGEDEAGGSAEAALPGLVRISTEKVQKLGVRTEAAALRVLGQTVRAAGRVEPDERRVVTVNARFEGYVERLHVNATGQTVSRGQPLFDAYSPELVAAQREYLIALQGRQALKEAQTEAQSGLQQLAESSLAHLRHWDLSPEQLADLVRTGQVLRSVSMPAPISGVVTEKKALQGMRFMPGEMLYQLTDLSSVWVIADVAEQDIGQLRSGARARITTAAYPGEVFSGNVTLVYPTMKAETRTVPVRIELANPRQRLKPAMYAQVEFATGPAAAVLTVPDSALIDTGTRRLVLVQRQPGRFEPREVKVGRRGDNLIEVLEGLREGEQVVVAANFLIDAESNLKAALGTLGAASAAAAPANTVGHQAEGSVDALDTQAGTLSLNHGPVASLKWPAMTMEFQLAHAGLAKGLKPGQAVRFEFIERKPGEYVVTAIAPTVAPQAASKPAASGGKNAHSGH